MSAAHARDEMTESMLCQEAVQALQQALNQPSLSLTEEVDQAERAVVRLRDALIERLRASDPASEDKQLRARLNIVNMCLSCIAGVEYPAGGIQRKLLEQAHEELVRLSEK